MRYAIILSITLTGCASPPQWMANYYDRQDPCQNHAKVDAYIPPSFCGASANRAYIYAPNGAKIGYIKR